MKNNVKVIFHIDLNAFYATVSQINEPYLKNKIFVVGGSVMSKRGVITTSSYAARKLGIKAGMPFGEALRIYPKLISVPLNFNEYLKYSKIFFGVLSEYSDKVLKGSIDEGYVDMTSLSKTKHPIEIAKEIQRKLNEEHQLPVSIGIAPTLFLAKMASDMKKPLGITVLRRKDIVKKLLPLEIKELFGLGVKTYPKLMKKGINTIGDFTLEKNKETILKVMSVDAYNSFMNNILGKSTDIIDPKKYDVIKSISNETTFNYTIDNKDLIYEELENLLKRVVLRLKKNKLLAKTVTIKLRSKEFVSITRSKTLEDYSDSYEVFEDLMDILFIDNYDENELRLVGVGLSNLINKNEYEEEFNLFTYQKLLSK